MAEQFPNYHLDGKAKHRASSIDRNDKKPVWFRHARASLQRPSSQAELNEFRSHRERMVYKSFHINSVNSGAREFKLSFREK